MFGFSFVNLPENFLISEEKISEILNFIAKKVPITQRGILNIAFLPDEEIQLLNRDYRGIDKTTDVLSFHYFDDFSDLDSATDIAGECIFSEAKILEQAAKFEHSPLKEFEILFIHSVLHILGFDHETDEDFEAMWNFEKPIRENFSLSIKR
ncbi:rRNA maturation RNase YbeY [Candidatus Gracilibacteria bacterium]|nr:rRNA maturation RNase YbeY [Candidatus Gracilibacteria bacterium]